MVEEEEGFHIMTNPILENIRHSLKKTDQTHASLLPSPSQPRLPDSLDSEVERFLTEIKKLSGVPKKISTSEIEASLKDLIIEQNIQKACLWNTWHLKALGIAERLKTLGVEIISSNSDKHTIVQCDLGITEADFLLPETGTLVLRSSAEKPRAVSLAPRVHLAIARPEMLRADMHQVFAEAKDHHYLVFITGPSRTADIELTVTLGVHGPKNLYVWMMNE
jgi:L-lactate dehydrogenase complex protein LldG